MKKDTDYVYNNILSMKNYIPNPVDINDLSFDGDYLDIIEIVAKNIHERWAFNRMQEGWTFGPVRNDEKKETPCLVPYEELPEIEKEYDRNTAKTTIKSIIALGYKITK